MKIFIRNILYVVFVGYGIGMTAYINRGPEVTQYDLGPAWLGLALAGILYLLTKDWKEQS